MAHLDPKCQDPPDREQGLGVEQARPEPGQEKKLGLWVCIWGGGEEGTRKPQGLEAGLLGPDAAVGAPGVDFLSQPSCT